MNITLNMQGEGNHHHRKNDTASSHITKHRLSEEQRDIFRQRLSVDPVFGPLLNLYASIINRPELYG